MSGYLTTHVLDTAQGRPGNGIRIDLFRLSGETRTFVQSLVTNSDGRTDSPILAADDFAIGEYELVFHVGAYFDAAGLDLPEPKFLNEVPLRFGMSEEAHYHVPLLVSPFGYSTYRGS